MRWIFSATTGQTDEATAAHYVAPRKEHGIEDLLAHQRELTRDTLYSVKCLIEGNHMNTSASPVPNDAARP